MHQKERPTQSASISVAQLPAHEVIYRKLRAKILFGELVPGQPVTIQGLTEHMSAGMTPVREAIRRLTAQGALEFQGNRRVCVPILNADHISELIQARSWLDPYLTERASAHVSGKDIDSLTASDTDLDRAISNGNIRLYLEHNYHFHSLIYQLAGAPILADLAEGLWLRFGPSLRMVCGMLGTEKLPDRHKEVLSALRTGDAKAAAQAMREDVVQGMEQVRRALTTQ